MKAPIAAALVLACATPALAKAPTRTRVVVTVVVDQLAAWALDERRALLPADGGFARLVREGTYVKEMRYAHAATDTAPGHASLYTGVPPRQSGIVCNERVDPTDRARRVSYFLDPSVQLVDERGPSQQPASSLRRLRVDTLADRLRAERPDARVVAISLKDRGVLFGGGKKPSAAIWYDLKSDRIVTTTAYASVLPTWAVNAVHGSVTAAYGKPWQRTLPDAALPAGLIDDRPGEGVLSGTSRHFPHATDTPELLRASPAGDRLVFDLARAAIAEAAPPALLALSFSSYDYVAHVYGSDSIESYEELFALDRTLAELMRALDERLGAGGWSMVLAADHGASPLPETPTAVRAWCRAGTDRWQRPCSGGHRLDRAALSEQLDLAASSIMGGRGWVAGIVDPYVQLGERYYAAEPSVRARVLQAISAAMAREPGVARVLETAKLPATCPSIDVETIDALVCRATAPPDSPEVERGGELYVLLSPGSFFDTQIAPRAGGSHGTPYLFDRAVPLLVRDLDCVARGVVVEGPISFASFHRTAAALLGLTEPAAGPGRSFCAGPMKDRGRSRR